MQDRKSEITGRPREFLHHNRAKNSQGAKRANVIIGLFSHALSDRSAPGWLRGGELRVLDGAPDSPYRCRMRLGLISCLLFGTSCGAGMGGEGRLLSLWR